MNIQVFIEWYDIKTAPVDEWVTLATSGEHVGQAIYGENEEEPRWRWACGAEPVHPNLKPLKWMPLPKHPQL